MSALNHLPLATRRESSTATTTNAALQHLVYDIISILALKHPAQSLKTARCAILVQIQWIDMAITLGRDTHLMVKEGVNLSRALLLGRVENIIPRLVGVQNIYLVEQRIFPPFEDVCCGKVVQQNLLNLLRAYIRIAGYVAALIHHINHRHLITRTHTRDRLYLYGNAQLLLCLHHSLINLGCTTHLTTVLHTQTHLANIFIRLRLIARRLRMRLEVLLVLCQYGLHPARLYVAVNLVVNLHYGSQRATTQTSNLLYRVTPIGRSYAILGDIQLTAEGIIDRTRPLHVAGCADADLDGMLSIGDEPKLRIECSDAQQLGTCDFRPLIYSLQCIRRKIRKLLLQGLQERNHIGARATHTSDDSIYATTKRGAVGLNI